MDTLLALVGLLALLVIVAHLVRTIAADGRGSRPAPRSHREEIGSWVDQQLHG